MAVQSSSSSKAFFLAEMHTMFKPPGSEWMTHTGLKVGWRWTSNPIITWNPVMLQLMFFSESNHACYSFFFQCWMDKVFWANFTIFLIQLFLSCSTLKWIAFLHAWVILYAYHVKYMCLFKRKVLLWQLEPEEPEMKLMAVTTLLLLSLKTSKPSSLLLLVNSLAGWLFTCMTKFNLNETFCLP